MKRISLLFLLSVVALVVAAQPRETSVGVSFDYRSYTLDQNLGATSEAGIGVRLQRELIDQLMVLPNATLWLNDKSNNFDAAIDLHYHFVAGLDFCIYPIGGVSFTRFSNGIDPVNRVGGNLGLGLQYNITGNLVVNGEYKYHMFKDFEQVHFALSLGWRF